MACAGALLAVGCPSSEAEDPSEPESALAAADYCEATVEMFCDYYLRCGRMAVDSIEACRATFLETCNGRYEPRYRSLEAHGMIALSQAGMEACAAHLATVDCPQQIFDLDGPCADMWQGQVPAEGSCGLGIESFVCGEGTTCVVGLDLCGTCRPTVEVGEGCGDGVHCESTADCVDGTCVRRALPGQSCDAAPCVLGARCEEGRCVADTVVGLAEPCDATHTCAYRAVCVGGSCVQTGLYGDPCGADAPCASGWCDAGSCAPLRAGGEACTEPSQCVSGICNAGQCSALPGPCFE